MRSNQPTAMELAFLNAKLPVSLLKAPLVGRVMETLERRAKSRKKAPPDKGWSCNLSFRTYRQLVAKGVPVQ